MSMILALWNRTGEPVDEAVLRSMLALNTNPGSDGQDFWLEKEVALAHQHFWITPEEKDQPQPLLDPASGCVITCTARLDNRRDLIQSFGLVEAEGKPLSDADLILRAYRRWGIECPASLLGDFAFVIWDPAEHQMFAARDALGGQELCYLLSRQIFIMASRINILLGHPSVKPKLNETKIADYLSSHWTDDFNSYYDSIFHLPPAHCLLVTAESSRLWRYWEVDPGRILRYSRPEEYAEHYREIIKEAVRCRLRSAYPVGISLSGGLDSSSLTCLACEVLAETGTPGGSLGSYSYVFDEFPNCDERTYIQAVVKQAAKLYPISARMVQGDTLWPAPFKQDWLISRDYPYQDPYYYLLKASLQAAHQDGLRGLLNGFYGDDLYSGSDTWFADLVLAWRIRQAAMILTRSARQVNLKRDLLDYGLRAMIPLGLKKYYRGLRSKSPEWAEWIHPHLAAGIRPEKPEVLPINHPKFRLPGQQKRYAALFFAGYPERVTILQDIAQDSGMEYWFPFMDRRIVEFVLRLPPEQIALPGISRWILREALVGKMPEVVRQRQDKAALSELFEKGVYDNRLLNLQEIFLHSQVLEREYINRDWLMEEINCKWRTQFGVILWLVVSLESWLRKYW